MKNFFLVLFIFNVGTSVAFRIKREQKNVYEFDEDIEIPTVHRVRGFSGTTLAPRKADECRVDVFTPTMFIPNGVERREHGQTEMRKSDESCHPCSSGSQFSYIVGRGPKPQVVGSFVCPTIGCIETVSGRQIELKGQNFSITPVGKCNDNRCDILLSVDDTVTSSDIDVTPFRTSSIESKHFMSLPIRGFSCESCEQSIQYCDESFVDEQ